MAVTHVQIVLEVYCAVAQVTGSPYFSLFLLFSFHKSRHPVIVGVAVESPM